MKLGHSRVDAPAWQLLEARIQVAPSGGFAGLQWVSDHVTSLAPPAISAQECETLNAGMMQVHTAASDSSYAGNL